MKKVRTNEELWAEFDSKHCIAKGISKRTRHKWKMHFNLLSRFMNNKPFEKVVRADLEKLLSGLRNNEYKKINGEDLSGDSKADLRKFIKLFWKVIWGNGETYPPIVSWIHTNIPKDERAEPKEIISYDEVVEFAAGFNKPQHRILALIGFDSGLRIDELRSVLKRDLTLEEYESGKKCYFIKCNRSKTFTRKVDIPLFTRQISEFINSTYFQNLKSDEPIWSSSYNSLWKVCGEVSERVLHKHLSPHCLRHSSATYYATVYCGDIFLMMQRFGWVKPAQAMVYVRMSGIQQKQSVKKIYDNEVGKLRSEMVEMQDKNKAMAEALNLTILAFNKFIDTTPNTQKIKSSKVIFPDIEKIDQMMEKIK